jgi:hypothetical protein
MMRVVRWTLVGLGVGAVPLLLSAVHPGSEVVTAHGGGDSTTQAAYLTHALKHLPWSGDFWNLPVFWPTEWTTVMMDPLLAQAWLLRVLWWGAGTNPALDTNLLFVLTLASGFWATALLVRRLGMGNTAGALAGGVYVLGPFAAGHWLHLNQLPSAWIPLSVWAWQVLTRSDGVGRRRASVVLAVCIVMQLLSSLYMFTTLAIILAAAVLFWPPRDREGWLLSTSVAAVGGLAVALWARPFESAVKTVASYGREVAETGAFQARLFDLANAAESHLLAWPAHELARPALYPGLIWLGLGAVGALLLFRRQPRHAVFLVVVSLMGLLLSFGRSHPDPSGVEWTMPFAILQDHISALHAIRDPSRFFLMTHLALAVLGAYAFERVLAPRRWGVWVLLLALLDIAPGATAKVRVTPTPQDRQVLQWLAAQPAPAVWSFAPLPCVESEERLLDARATLWAAVSGVPTVGGSTGFVPPAIRQLRQETCGQPLNTVAEILRSHGVRWLVLERGARPGTPVLPWPTVLENSAWTVHALREPAS